MVSTLKRFEKNGVWHLTKFLSTFFFVSLLFIVFSFTRGEKKNRKNEFSSVDVINTHTVKDVPSTRFTMKTLLSVYEEPIEIETTVAIDSFVGALDGENSFICPAVIMYGEDRCEYVSRECPFPFGGGFVNFLYIKYCTFFWLPDFVFYIFAFFFIAYLFYLLGDLADADFCPSLNEISTTLKMPEDVAGVTFLALGNGAPDIFSIFVSVFSVGSSGLGVGEPIGSGMVITTLVFGVVCLLSNLQVPPYQFIRDVIFYMASVGFVLISVVTGNTIELWESALYLVLYLAYVLVVIFGKYIENFFKKLQKLRKIKKSGGKYTGEEDEISSSSEEEQIKVVENKKKEEGDKKEKDIITKSLNEDEIIVVFGDEEKKKIKSLNKAEKEDEIFGLDDDDDATEKRPLLNKKPTVLGINVSHTGSLLTVKRWNSRAELDDAIVEDHFSTNPKDGEDEIFFEDHRGWWKKKNIFFLSYFFCVKIPIKFIKEELHWDDKQWYEKLIFLLNLPVNILRILTIPKSNPEEWSKLFACLSSFFFCYFTAFVLTQDPLVMIFGFPFMPVFLVVGAILSVIIFFTTRRKFAPIFNIIIVFVSFSMSILWIYFVANEIVNLLETLGILFSISESIIGITILSWGNSIGDLFADVATSRSGKPNMAVAAIFSGPALNLLIGLGVAVTASCIKNGEWHFKMGENVDITLVCTFVILFVSLLSSLIIVPLTRFKVSKFFGFYLLLLYFCFIIMGVLIELEVMFPPIEL